MRSRMDAPTGRTCATTRAGTSRSARAFTLAVAVLAVVALLSALMPLYRGQFLAQIDQNEGWIAYHVQALLAHRGLYPPPSELITNNYPA
jgi:hypothetical protein